MDIIKHGKYKINKYQICCQYCGCVFTYNDYDLHDWCGCSPKYYVNCPECGRWNRHDKYSNVIEKVNKKLGE